jgi:ATP/maltotriose-dependent transcriptional regulator MalT
VASLERTTDSAGLARAWHLVSVIEGTSGRYDRAAESGQLAVRHATNVDDTRYIARGVLDDAYSALHGTTPVAEALQRCEAYLPLIHGNRTAESTVLAVLAQLTAMSGRIEEARSLSGRAREMVADLGPSSLTASLSDHTSRVEILGGDLLAAERELRRDYDVLEAMGEAYSRSTIAALLAQVLWDQGRFEDAAQFADISSQLADEDDLYSQVLFRMVQAKALALDGQPQEAVAAGEHALAMLEGTVDIELRADCLMDFAEVLGLAGRENDRGPHIREALGLYEQKGDVVLAAATARRLAETEAVPAG